jgi:hypothetical protein
MADGTIRLTLDLLSGTEDDISAAYIMMKQDITVTLVKTELIEAAQAEYERGE